MVWHPKGLCRVCAEVWCRKARLITVLSDLGSQSGLGCVCTATSRSLTAVQQVSVVLLPTNLSDRQADFHAIGCCVNFSGDS